MSRASDGDRACSSPTKAQSWALHDLSVTWLNGRRASSEAVVPGPSPRAASRSPWRSVTLLARRTLSAQVFFDSGRLIYKFTSRIRDPPPPHKPYPAIPIPSTSALIPGRFSGPPRANRGVPAYDEREHRPCSPVVSTDGSPVTVIAEPGRRPDQLPRRVPTSVRPRTGRNRTTAMRSFPGR